MGEEHLHRVCCAADRHRSERGMCGRQLKPWGGGGGAFQTSIGGAVWFEVRGERVLGKQLTMTDQEPTRRATQAQEPSTMTP